MPEKSMRGSLEDLAWQHLVLAKEYGALTRYFARIHNTERRLEVERFEKRHMEAFELLTKDDTPLYQKLMQELAHYGQMERASWEVKKSDWR